MEHKLYITTVALITFTFMAFTSFTWRNLEQSPYIIRPIPRPKVLRKVGARMIAKEMKTSSRPSSVYKVSDNMSLDTVEETLKDESGIVGRNYTSSLPTNEDEGQSSHTSSLSNDEDKEESKCVKQIQLWAKRGFEFPEKEYECPDSNCKVRYIHSNSYERLATSHAVILHHKGNWNWEDMARNRPDGQMWIYMSKETPINSKRKLSPIHFQISYNWSMTYHTKSDITIPYGRYFENSPEIPQSDGRNWATGKTRLVAWMASNCGSTSWDRTKFVKTLQNYVQVDTYGICGKNRCPRRSKVCDRILSTHKFYLSLENSECQDYITEKFWEKGLLKNMVPIVYGTTRSDYEKVAPPHSFIHISDFKNMTALVNYIIYLDKNDTAYNEYFEWKKEGSVEHYTESQAHTAQDIFCGIVKKLKVIDDQLLNKDKFQPEIADINNWWRTSCHHLESIWSP